MFYITLISIVALEHINILKSIKSLVKALWLEELTKYLFINFKYLLYFFLMNQCIVKLKMAFYHRYKILGLDQ